MKKFLHNVVERIKSRREGRSTTEYQITWDEKNVRVDWLTLENNPGSMTFSWDSVLAVDTFKRDLFAVDCICLALETPAGWCEVNEEMKGWDDFVTALGSHLSGFPPRKKWWGEVLQPPFAAKHARLWNRTGNVPPPAA
ncbi:MAG TPA: hypothetical protein VL527_17240 [Dongiaceae bacterium]|jgi:hypothetical protein|nr:hypothetical protein [Dongiaceae bacterium]